MDHLDDCCWLDCAFALSSSGSAAENNHGCSHPFPCNFKVIAECWFELGRCTSLQGLENDRVSLLAHANKSRQTRTAQLTVRLFSVVTGNPDVRLAPS